MLYAVLSATVSINCAVYFYSAYLSFAYTLMEGKCLPTCQYSGLYTEHMFSFMEKGYIIYYKENNRSVYI